MRDPGPWLRNADFGQLQRRRAPVVQVSGSGEAAQALGYQLVNLQNQVTALQNQVTTLQRRIDGLEARLPSVKQP